MFFPLARLKFWLTIAIAVGLICVTLPTIAQTSNSSTNTLFPYTRPFPNSQMGAVANLTKSWSRVDLNVPVAYDTDTLAAIEIIEATAIEMSLDPKWRWQISEKPQIKGVDDFSDRGLMVKIWIKTRPLKQFDVAREYRLRLKLAFDKAGILIPVPQQNISVHPNSVSNNNHGNNDLP